MHREVPVIRPALVAAFLTIAVACHGTDTAAPPAWTHPSRSSQDGHADADDHPRSRDVSEAGHAAPIPVTCARRERITASGTFGPGGGTLVIGGSRLLIPGGALRDTVTISATVQGDTTSTVHFRPEGLRFRKPAGLSLSTEGCAVPGEGDASIVYLGTDGQILETIEGIYYRRFKTVAAPIEHFSGYAIAFREE